jgi:hypothetical protein
MIMSVECVAAGAAALLLAAAQAVDQQQAGGGHDEPAEQPGEPVHAGVQRALGRARGVQLGPHRRAALALGPIRALLEPGDPLALGGLAALGDPDLPQDAAGDDAQEQRSQGQWRAPERAQSACGVGHERVVGSRRSILDV